MNSFHVRTELPAAEIVAGEKNARKQEYEIYDVFYRQPERLFSSYDLLQRFPSFPITSIRRALTNLHKAGKLIFEGKAPGPLNVSVSRYRVAPPMYGQISLPF